MKKSLMPMLGIGVMFVNSMLFGATLQSMSRAQIMHSFVNKTLTSIGVDNLDGKTVNNSTAIFLDGHGKAYGKMGYKPKNEAQFDQGAYQINADGTVYLTWIHWDYSKKLCFHIFETINAYLSVDCNNIYHSTFMKSDAHRGNQIR